MTIVKMSEVERLLDYLGRLLIEAHANGHVGDATVPVPYHVLNDMETCLENVKRDQEDRGEAETQSEPRWLADEVARCKKCDVSEARRLITVGQVDVNNRRVEDPAAQVREGDMVEVYNSTRQIFMPWRVGE